MKRYLKRYLNKPLIREIQLSILDSSRPFSMLDWDSCIAGHCFKVLGARGLLKLLELQESGPAAYASAAMGIPFHQAYDLFTVIPSDEIDNRLAAVQKLDALLKHKPSSCDNSLRGSSCDNSLRGSLRGKARSRSPRATLSETQEETQLESVQQESLYWHGLPPCVEVDLTSIDALLREAEEEMLQPA